MQISPDKQIAKLQKIIERLSGGEIVQNRQLKTVLGTEEYARYLSDPLMLAYCKSVYTGSIPVPASIKINCLDDYFPQKYAKNLMHHSYTLRAQFFTWEKLISRVAIDQRLPECVFFVP